MTTRQTGRENMEHVKNQRRRASLFAFVWNYFNHHISCALRALSQFKQSKWLYGMTLSVIGIAIAIPFGFYLALSSVHDVFDKWHEQAQISLYLTNDATDWKIKVLEDRLKANQKIDSVAFIDKDSALRDFESISGLENITDGLEDNPLPDVFHITPVAGLPVTTIKNLQKTLEQDPLVVSAVLDSEWLERLDALLAIVKRASFLMAITLCGAIVLIISNSIRLMIESRKQEIEIISLIGATSAFVRRPFLYTGFWLGFFGGLFACLTIALGAAYLNTPVQHLGQLYGIEWEHAFIQLQTYGLILFYSTVMGLVGAWLAVSRQIALFTRVAN